MVRTVVKAIQGVLSYFLYSRMESFQCIKLELFRMELAVHERIHPVFIHAFNSMSIGFKQKSTNENSIILGNVLKISIVFV